MVGRKSCSFYSTKFGFHSGTSCVDNLTTFSTYIQSAFTESQFLTAVFLDTDGAYDNVKLNIISKSHEHSSKNC